MDTPTALVPLTGSTAIAIPSEDDGGLLSFDQLFEPTRGDTLIGLLAEYKVERANVERIAALFTDKADRTAVQHFLDAARTRHNSGHIPSPDTLFQLDPAIAVLNAKYWQRALNTTDVYESMPQPRRDEWNEQISKHTTPDFDDVTVVATLDRLLGDRKHFFAEKVAGVFDELSRNHKTNKAFGFSKRMIIEGVYAGMFGSERRAGTLHDLREVIARFMGRDVPPRWTMSTIVEHARAQHGDWVPIDGGAWRLKVFMNGNGHVEIHPDMAWRLNLVLASIRPLAIAAEHCKRPTSTARNTWPLYSRPLPFDVLAMLQRGKIEDPRVPAQVRRDWHDDWRKDDDALTDERIEEFAHAGIWRYSFDYSTDKGPVRNAATEVLRTLGAIRHRRGGWEGFDFTFNPRSMLRMLYTTGCYPDDIAHQYYPTPRGLAGRVIAAADIGEGMTVLEPSAGQGGLAGLLPKDRTTCVEVSSLFCEVLRAKGFAVIEGDFLAWNPGMRFDRIVMNPPFSEGRWRAHLLHAVDLAAYDGRIVAVLPSTAIGKVNRAYGWTITWSEPEPFPGTSIMVTIMIATRSDDDGA